MTLKVGSFIIISFVLVLSGFRSVKDTAPELGIVASIERDSLVHAAGFTMMGESVGRMLSPALTEEQFKVNLQRIKKAQTRVMLCNIFISGGMKLVGPQVNEAWLLAYADTVFARAQKASIPFIILGSGGARRVPEGFEAKQATTEFTQLCRKLATVAAKYKVTIALENLQSSETNFLNTVKDAAAVVRAVNHPNFKLNADIFHMLREGESPQSIVDAADILVYSEIAEKEKRSFPGVKGDDFKPYLRALRKANYKGFLFIEGSSDKPEKDMPIAYEYLSRQLAEVYAE